MNVKNNNRLNKADRHQYIVTRMRVEPGITPTTLASELKVSERTVYRDMRLLQTKQTIRKRYSRREGRYVFETELVLPPVTFTPSEASALYSAAAGPALAENTFFANDLRAALDKIVAICRTEVESVNDGREGAVMLSAPEVSPESLQQPVMELIRRAMRLHRKVRVRYWSPTEDNERMLTLAPLDLRYQHHWYLLARSEEQDSIRLFKVSRLRVAEITTERYRFPRNFSAEAAFARAWERHDHRDGEVRVRVRFAPSVAVSVAQIRGRQFSQMEWQADGSLLGTLTVHSVKEVRWWIFSYGSAAEILEPVSLREEFSLAAQAMANLYVSK